MEANTGVELSNVESSCRPPGMPWVSPYLTVKDAGVSMAFYEAAFGFTVQTVNRGEDGTIMHVEMTWHDGVVMLGPEGAYGGLARSPATSGVLSPVHLYVYSEDVDKLFERAVAAGATVDFPPSDMFWGDRACKLTDPDGHAWNFATHKEVAAT